jgi:hypothetical protein
MDAAGDDVEVLTETTSEEITTDTSTETSDTTEELDCHFHAGVE